MSEVMGDIVVIPDRLVRIKTRYFRKPLCWLVLVVALCVEPGFAFSLWSTNDSISGTGEFLGPGSFKRPQPLFEMVITSIAFYSPSNAVVPFENNGSLHPNICADGILSDKPSGALETGNLINENVNTCIATVADTNMLIAVINGGVLQGQQIFTFHHGTRLDVAMDIAFDLGIGPDGVIKMPFVGTTGRVTIPFSIQTQLGIPGGVDGAGLKMSGESLEGSLGDADKDGWLDGTLVSVGNIPLDSPVFPGQPYAMIRHFETDIEAGGAHLGNIADVKKINTVNVQKK